MAPRLPSERTVAGASSTSRPLPELASPVAAAPVYASMPGALPPPHTLRNSVQISVRAKPGGCRSLEATTGTIAIVLDYSGSMRARTAGGREDRRGQEGLGDGAPGCDPGGNDPQFLDLQPGPRGLGPDYERPDRPRARENDHSALEAHTLESGPDTSTDGATRSVRALPRNPLVQAMWTAANSDLKDARGPRTLLVLTDGADTRFLTNRAFNPAQLTVPVFLLTQLNQIGRGSISSSSRLPWRSPKSWPGPGPTSRFPSRSWIRPGRSPPLRTPSSWSIS